MCACDRIGEEELYEYIRQTYPETELRSYHVVFNNHSYTRVGVFFDISVLKHRKTNKDYVTAPIATFSVKCRSFNGNPTYEVLRV